MRWLWCMMCILPVSLSACARSVMRAPVRKQKEVETEMWRNCVKLQLLMIIRPSVCLSVCSSILIGVRIKKQHPQGPVATFPQRERGSMHCHPSRKERKSRVHVQTLQCAVVASGFFFFLACAQAARAYWRRPHPRAGNNNHDDDDDAGAPDRTKSHWFWIVSGRVWLPDRQQTNSLHTHPGELI